MHFDFGLKNYRAHQEFLHTNGLGSFTSGLVQGGRNRRYHGLLCASLNPPTDRFMMVSHIIETVSVDQHSWKLSQEFYQDATPESYAFMPKFSATPYPQWDFFNEHFQLKKSCWMTPDENTTNLSYENTGQTTITLNLKPLMALRDYHYLRQGQDTISVQTDQKTLRIHSHLPTVHFYPSKGNWDLNKFWYHQNYYEVEAHRGYDSIEELFNPAEITITLKPGAEFSCQITLEEKPLSVKKSRTLATKSYKHFEKYKLPAWGTDAFYAANQCVVARKSTDTKTILAGYPWFTDWGRDTLISLRAFKYFLDKKTVQSIILAFLKYEKNGLIPNRFPDRKDDQVEYNTVDATLWLFVAIYETGDLKTDKKFIKSLVPTLKKIIDHHLKGTDFGIKTDEKTGFLFSGQGGQQLTWMDARIGEKVITPRAGFPVEVQALWYNALKIYQALSGDDKAYLELTQNIEQAFTAHFWHPENQYLSDLLDADLKPNQQLRPNQVYALSLPFGLIEPTLAAQALSQIEQHLKTSLGLRTLSMEDAEFQVTYEGDQWHRDHAYHQGTVWPFLLTDYWRAYEKLKGTEALVEQLKEDTPALIHHFYHDSGINGFSEVFDGLKPETGKGCTHQAWSLAALVYAAEKLKEA